MEPKIIYLDPWEKTNPLYPYDCKDKKEFHAAIALRGWNVVATSIYAHEPKVAEFVKIPLEANVYAINEFLEDNEKKLIEAARQARRRENAKEIADLSELDAQDIYETATDKLAELCEDLQAAADEHNWHCPEKDPNHYRYEGGEPVELLKDCEDPWEVDLSPMGENWELVTIAEQVAYALQMGIDDEARDELAPVQIRAIEKFASEHTEPCLAQYNNGLDHQPYFTKCDVTDLWGLCGQYWVKKINSEAAK